MSNRKITVFTKYFWPQGSGGELATYLILYNSGLTKKYEVTIVSGTDKPIANILTKCNYIHWPVLKEKHKPIEWFKLFFSSSSIENLIRNSDVIYIPSHTLYPISIFIKKINPNVKIIFHLHNYQPISYTSVIFSSYKPNLYTDTILEILENDSILRSIGSGYGHFFNWINRLAFYYADKIIFVSKRQLQIVGKYLPLVNNKGTVIYNPIIEYNSFKKKFSEKNTILYTSGGSYIKGYHLFIKVLLDIIKRIDITFYITYGRSMPYTHEKVLRKIKTLSPDNIYILGRIPYEKLIRLYENAWGLLFTSIWEEPLPYSILEAAIFETIPLAPRLGGITEILENTSAEKFLYTPGKLEDIKRVLEIFSSMSISEIKDIAYELKDNVKKKFDNNYIYEKIIDLFY